MNANEKKYVVFISYSRKDKRVAEWLLKELESYRLPDIEKARKIFSFESNYFRPVFLDLHDLHVEERPFTEKIQVAIENSAFLIVICSKNSAVSPFVNLEISHFLKTHNNNYSKIVPIFIDEVNGAIPTSFDGTSIMERHFPIFNSGLAQNSEANRYCFLQVISYILHINFSDIYNRYEIEEEKKRKHKRKIWISISCTLMLVLCILCIAFYKYYEASNEALKKEQELINFEKKVFPQAVVHGYERNFVTPVIKYLKKEKEEFRIFVLMPQNERDLTHQDRVGDFEYEATRALGIDSIAFVSLPTQTSRGSRILRIYRNGIPVEGVYLDFATTTTSFLEIAKFKRKHDEYTHTPIDSIIAEYSHDFVLQVKEQLKNDSIYISFVYGNKSMIELLKPVILNNPGND